MLGVLKGMVWKLCRDGRLNYEQVGRVRWIWVSDIEDYKRLQKIWDEKGGKWTAYGRAERKDVGGWVDGCVGGKLEWERGRAGERETRHIENCQLQIANCKLR